MSTLATPSSSVLRDHGQPGQLLSRPGSVTRLINSLRQGHDEAALKLWDRYFARMVRLARKQLGNTSRAVYDEEDVALSAFKSVFLGIGRTDAREDFDRDAFWKFVATITMRKVYHIIAYGQCQKRNPIRHPDAPRRNICDAEVVQSLLSRELTPDQAAGIEDEFQSLLDALPKLELRKIVILKLEGYSNQEIATQLGRGLSSVERKLKSIREIWANEFPI